MCSTGNAKVSCIDKERQALFAFKQSLSNSSMLSSWTGQDCCSWDGVLCNNITGHVMELHLSEKGLIGSEVSPSLAELKHLELLDLSSNNFSASKIPSFFGNFKSLRTLYLYDASFAGVVPPSLGNLSNLEYLDISSNNFSASKIPSFFGNIKSLRTLRLSGASFYGVVPPSLGNLSNLEVLDLYELELLEIDNLNWLSQLSLLQSLDLSWVDLSQVPDISQVFNSFPLLSDLLLSRCGLNEIPLSSLSYTKLTKLNWLDLSANNFSGPLPDWLTQLPSIEDLFLSSNSFSGAIPSSFFPKSSPLRNLDLSSNQLNGTIPESIGQLSNLQALDLSSNQLNGTIPESIGQLSNIQSLDLYSNHLNGTIPESIGQLSNIQSLDLYSNQLNGTIPESIGQLSNLRWLYLENNSFSGIISEIHFNKLVHLEHLYLGSNNLTMNVSTDWVPPFQLWSLNLGSCKFENGFPRWLQTQNLLVDLFMGNAEISGSYHFEDIVPLLPSSIESLDLSNCSISGFIPRNFRNVLPNLRLLILPRNNISGSIPVSFCELTKLTILDLAHNHLHGDLPQSCWSDSLSMAVLDLSSNNLTGLIPSSVRNWSRLSSLHLKNNQFFGELPIAMESCLSLEILDLASNKFSGNLPTWVKRLKYLRILNLRSNQFDGSLVHELCAISTLQILDLANNNFVETIPSCFRNFSGMILGCNTKSFYGEGKGYTDSLIQIIKGRELEYQKILKFLVNLDLSSNNLMGHIPEELRFLSGLRNFNLSHNRLTGSIPKKIGNLQNLESLDFSHNHLTGMIPQSISEITSLAHLNLSYNDLSGKIPTGNQLQTLIDPSIYEGNRHLCGIQIEKECIEGELFHFIEGNGKTNEIFEMLGFYIGLIVGIVVGFWGVIGVLFFKRTWRYTYFRFVENIYEMLVAKIAVCISLLEKK